jgi:hypothetical protein
VVFFATGIEVGSAVAVAVTGVADGEMVTSGNVDATVTEDDGPANGSGARNVTVALEVVFPSIPVPPPAA